MTSAAKVAEVLAIEPGPFDPAGCRAALIEAIETYALNLTGDPYRDIDRCDSHLDDDGVILFGYQGSVRRLLLHVDTVDAPRMVELTVRATKGATDVLDVGWGKTGPEIGNSILIARLLHVAICVMRQQGICTLINEPHDDRLRTHYSSMGFEAGRRLDLSDAAMLERAFAYVDAVYRRSGALSLSLPPP